MDHETIVLLIIGAFLAGMLSSKLMGGCGCEEPAAKKETTTAAPAVAAVTKAGPVIFPGYL